MVGSAIFISKLYGRATAMTEECKDIVDDVSNKIHYLSSEYLCPVDTGALKSTARREQFETDTRYYNEISYGGTSKIPIVASVDHPYTALGTGELFMGFRQVDYAWYVHEMPYRHYNPPSAQRKYLETAVNEYRSELISRIWHTWGSYD
jgi:hypothetical protein